MDKREDYSMFKFLQIVALMLVVQSLYAADKLQWGTPIISQDGSTIIRSCPMSKEDGSCEIGFFSSNEKLRHSIRVENDILNLRLSQDGYLGVLTNGLTGSKILFLYCPLGHLIGKIELKDILWNPPFAIANNGNTIAVFLIPIKENDDRLIEIFDSDGKKKSSLVSPPNNGEMIFLDDSTLLILSSKKVIAFDVNTGKNNWVTNVDFDLCRGQSVTISTDGTIFLVVDFIRSNTNNENLLIPRMRLFKSTTGEIITQKMFEIRSSDKIPDGFQVSFDAEKHQFSISKIADMSINY